MVRFFAVLFAAALVGCGSRPATVQSYDAGAVPAGAVGDLVKFGHQIIVNTRKELPGRVVARMDCAACHLEGGTKPRGGSFVGIYAQFPQWNARAKRVISLQDRLTECFLYSMNGYPPAYNSRAMEAMVAYIAYLSRGTPVGASPDPAARFTSFKPLAGDLHRGAQIFTEQCESCHGANGAGKTREYPPLWGPSSFNDGAGMAKASRMAGFVKYNMPANAPGTLSDQEASDVTAFVLSHARPHFNRARLVRYPAVRAGYF